jgi:hypothetical protein
MSASPNWNLNEVFSILRRRWCEASPGRNSASLTDHLNLMLGQAYSRQAVSQWATGTDKRKPPQEVIMLLLDELGLELRYDGSGKARLASREANRV